MWFMSSARLNSDTSEDKDSIREETDPIMYGTQKNQSVKK